MTSDKPQKCADCLYWRKDWGTFTATGWTGSDSDRGECHVEPKVVARRGDDTACRHGVKK